MLSQFFSRAHLLNSRAHIGIWLGYFVALAVLLGASSYVIFSQLDRAIVSQNVAAAISHTELGQKDLDQSFREILGDVFVMSKLPGVLDYAAGQIESRVLASRILWASCHAYPRYVSMQILAPGGNPIIRVDRKSDVCVELRPDANFIPADILATIKDITPGETYISDVIVHGADQPGRASEPVVYIARKLLDDRGNVSGTLILTVNLHSDLEAALSNVYGAEDGVQGETSFALNRAGDYLLVTASHAGGARKMEMRSDTFASEFPAMWLRVQRQELTQFDDDGLFVMKPLELAKLEDGQDISSRETLFVGTFVPRADLYVGTYLRGRNAPVLYTLFVSVIGLFSLLSALLTSRASVARQKQDLERLRFQDFSRATADFFWESDAEDQFRYFSDNFEEACNISAGDLLGRSARLLLETEAIQPPAMRIELFERLAARGAVQDVEFRYVDRARVTRWISISCVPFKDAQGNFAGYRGAGKIITAQKKVEANLAVTRTELEREKERFEQLFENAPDAYLVVTPTGLRILDCNQMTARMLGGPKAAILGRTIEELSAETQLSGVPTHQILEDPGSGYRVASGRAEFEWLHRRLDGHDLVVSVSVLPSKYQGRDARLVAWRDVSARKELERLEDEFISSVSHELRTPLTSITGSLGLLLGGVAGEMPPRATRLVDIAHKNAQRLTKLVNDLLDIDKIEAGQVTLKQERIDLNALAAQAVDYNRPYADRFGVRLALDAAEEPLFVTGDPDRLLQVVTNLLSNAVKHSPQGDVVTVGTRLGNGVARVSVADHGPGIPEQFRARIFQRFAQADASDRKAREGTGLGLAISRAIIDRHGGRIGFDSAVGAGSTFWFELPAPEARQALPAGLGFRILVCEANPQAALDMAGMLRGEAAQVDVATSMAQALKMLGERHYHVLVLELLLPDGNGLDLIRKVRDDARLRDLAVLVVSAAAEHHRGAADAGALNVLDWLDKTTLDRRHLVAAVEQAARAAEDSRPRVLHVEDEDDLREVVAVALAEFAEVDSVRSLAQASAMLGTRHYDVVIIDLALPDGSGAELLPVVDAGNGVPPAVIIFSNTLPSSDTLAKVQRALVKSQTSVEQLVEIVKRTRPRASARSGIGEGR